MDSFDLVEERTGRNARGKMGLIWNILTVLMLIATLVAVAFFALIYTNPYSALNPVPPPQVPGVLELPTLTPTSRAVLPPTWTPTETQPPTATPTLRPTSTLPPTPTLPAPAEPTQEAATPMPGGMPFVPQDGHPLAIADIYHPDQGCSWVGVGGQVYDMKGGALSSQQVQLGGVLNGTPIPPGSRPTLTGLIPNVPGYYEFFLADAPFASEQQLWVQLVDQYGQPISERVYFDTYDSCDKNLIIINFRQVR